MDFEIYCDESGLEALTREDAHLFTAIGGIWMPASYRSAFKENMYAIKEKHNIFGELKWKKVSPAFYQIYEEIIKGNYVVIIRFTGVLKAKLVTAYEKNDIENILNSPDFEKNEKYFGKDKA